MSNVKLNRMMKMNISKAIIKCGLKPSKILLPTQMVEIPGFEDAGGKPLFLPVKQYNKLVTKAYEVHNKFKNKNVTTHS